MDQESQLSDIYPTRKRYTVRRGLLLLVGVLVAFGLVVGGIIVAGSLADTTDTATTIDTSAAGRFPLTTVRSADLPELTSLPNSDSILLVSGQAQVTDGIVLTPGTLPATATKGSFYYDEQSNRPYFYNGSVFVSLQSAGATVQVTNNPTTIQQTFVDNSTSTTVVQGGGTTLSGLTTNGIAFADSATTLQTTANANNSVLITNNSGLPILDQTLPTIVQQNITATGALAEGSIVSGFGTISTANDITTSATVQAGQLQVNGTAQVSTDNTAAFTVQDAANNNLFTVDTTNTQIILGNDGAPSDVTIRGATASGNSVTGSNLTFDAANGTGLGGSGDLIFRTAPIADAVITLDNASHANAVNTSLTWTHATGTQSNMVLIVGINIQNSTRSVSSVTYKYNSGASQQSLTKVDSATANGVFSGEDVEMWYLPSPIAGSSPGTNTITVDTAGGSAWINAGAVTYYNVDPTNPLDLANKAKTSGTVGGGSNTVTTTVLNTTNGEIVADVFGNNNSGVVPTVDPGQTQRYSEVDSIWGSDKIVAGGSTSMSWTNLNSTDYVHIAVPVVPAPNTTPDTFADRLHITAAGNVGINVANPQHALDVNGTGRFAVDSTAAFQIQDASNTPLFTADTQNMIVTVVALEVSASLTVDGHVITAGATPAIGAGAAACTAPTVSVVGNDTAGEITVTSGTGCATPGDLATITFDTAYAAAPHVQLTPESANAAGLQIYETATTTTFTLATATAPTDGTAYTYNYLVVQ